MLTIQNNRLALTKKRKPWGKYQILHSKLGLMGKPEMESTSKNFNFIAYLSQFNCLPASSRYYHPLSSTSCAIVVIWCKHRLPMSSVTNKYKHFFSYKGYIPPHPTLCILRKDCRQGRWDKCEASCGG